MAYEVRTPVFEGPFDLLLHLIVDNRVDLFAVSLADIVDAYLGYLDELARLELEVASEFLLVASTLVELKARRLLPDDPDPDLDDELALWEERDLLLARLLEAKTFKDVAATFERRLADAGASVARAVGPDERFVGLTVDALEGVTAAELVEAYLRVVTRPPAPTVSTDHVNPIRVSVVDIVAEVAEEVRRAGALSFAALVAGLVDRVEIVVRFLAVLELTRRGLTDVAQPGGTCGDLTVSWLGETGEGTELGADLAAAAAHLEAG